MTLRWQNFFLVADIKYLSSIINKSSSLHFTYFLLEKSFVIFLSVITESTALVDLIL